MEFGKTLSPGCVKFGKTLSPVCVKSAWDFPPVVFLTRFSRTRLVREILYRAIFLAIFVGFPPVVCLTHFSRARVFFSRRSHARGFFFPHVFHASVDFSHALFTRFSRKLSRHGLAAAFAAVCMGPGVVVRGGPGGCPSLPEGLWGGSGGAGGAEGGVYYCEQFSGCSSSRVKTVWNVCLRFPLFHLFEVFYVLLHSLLLIHKN